MLDLAKNMWYKRDTMKAKPEGMQLNIEEMLTSVEMGVKHSWATIASLLLQAEQSGFWQQDFSSFAAWLSNTAKRLGLKNSMLWRYRRAALFYNQFYHEHIIPKGINIPDLEHLQDVSPDNLDLVEKISRVLPEDELVLLTKKVVTKEVGRRELLEKWQTLRVALEGRTARGKGVITPKLGSADFEKADIYIEDKVLTVLQNFGSKCLELEEPCSYSVMRSVSFKKLKQLKVNALIVVRKFYSSDVELHGLSIVTSLISNNLKPKQLPNEEFFDYTWLAFIESPPKEIIENLPENLGIIYIGERGYSLIRKATKSAKSGIQKISLLNDLLIKYLSI